MSDYGDGQHVEPLTEREQDVLRLLAQGKSNRAVADTLVLSLNTVKWYARQVYVKLGVASREEAVARARELGLIAGRAHERPRHNLPATATSFIGREQEVAAVCSYLAESGLRLVTLIGPPGVGKTRFSIEVARQLSGDFIDGVYFTALAPLAEPERVAQAMVHALGLVGSREVTERERLLAGIGERQLLLVVDNAEHLVEAVAELVVALLAGCPNLKILVTSRESLLVPGEWLYPLPPLAFPAELEHAASVTFPALRLFSERARAVEPGFAIDEENLPAVAAICREVDGLPLAIELIAARVRLMPPAALLARLHEGPALSADGMRGLPARQKSLENAIAWSYDLLLAEEQRLLAWLSVFRGGFTMEAVDGVCGPASELVSSLLDKSLLQRRPGDAGEARLAMLVTIRQFVAARLRERGEEAAARERHLVHFLALAERAAGEVHGPGQIEWINRVEAEVDNIQSALSWAVGRGYVEMSMRLLAAVAWPLWLRGYGGAVRHWFEKVHTLSSTGTYPLLSARLHLQMGRQSWLSGNFPQARDELAQAIALARAEGAAGQQVLAEALAFSGMVARTSGAGSDEVRSLFQQALDIAEQNEDVRGRAFSLLNFGWLLCNEEDPSPAEQCYQQSLQLFEQLGDSWGVGRVSQWLGDLYLWRGNVHRAAFYLNQHLSIDEALQFKQGIVKALVGLGMLWCRRGDYAQARQYYERSRALAQAYGLLWDETNTSYYLGLLALHEDDWVTARRHFIAYFDRARKIWEGIATAELLIALAAVAAGTRQPLRAARLLGAGEALLVTTNFPIPPLDRAEFDRHLEPARAYLGASAFTAAWNEGQTMSLEEAVALALEEPLPTA